MATATAATSVSKVTHDVARSVPVQSRAGAAASVNSCTHDDAHMMTRMVRQVQADISSSSSSTVSVGGCSTLGHVKTVNFEQVSSAAAAAVAAGSATSSTLEKPQAMSRPGYRGGGAVIYYVGTFVRVMSHVGLVT